MAVCIGGGLARSFVKCGSGMVWVRLNVDVDGSGGSKGKGSRMKGKRRKSRNHGWVKWKHRHIVMGEEKIVALTAFWLRSQRHL